MNSTPPSMNTRKRTRKRKSSSEPTTSEIISSTANNLPPPRRSSNLRGVSPPLSSTRLRNLICLLVGLTTLMGAVFSYRIVQYKVDVGGWWNLVLGRRPQVQMWANSGSPGGGREDQSRSMDESVEGRINSLASALGMPSSELASAIAGAVRSYVPLASRSSVAAKETGEAVKILLSEAEEGQEDISGSSGAAAEVIGVVEGLVNDMEGLVGMDELELDA